MTENYVQKIYVKNVVILGWFSFRKLCAKDLGEIIVIWGWFLFLADFVFRVLFFCFEQLLTILVGNNNKMMCILFGCRNKSSCVSL